MKILNGYCGIGGNRQFWGDDYEIVAIENDIEIAAIYQDFFPNDKVIIADAHKYLLKHFQEFDFIWLSPPCQSHSRCNNFLKKQGVFRYPDLSLWQEIIFLKHYFEGKYVVENVISYYKPFLEPLKFHRHYFWANFNITHKNINQTTQGLIGSVVNELKLYQELLNINLDGYKLSGRNNKRQILRNCVLPELGKHILDCATGSIKNETQLELF